MILMLSLIHILDGKRPLCIAVTCLTSLDQEILDNELLIHEELANVVLKWAQNAKEAGMDGVVCSPLESKIIHDELGNEFLTVTPGIRLASDNVNAVSYTHLDVYKRQL